MVSMWCNIAKHGRNSMSKHLFLGDEARCFTQQQWAIPFEIHTLSVRNFGCPCARDNQKSCLTTKNTDVVVQRTTMNFHTPSVKLDSIYIAPSTDNQKLGQTTRNCNLVTFSLNSNTAYTAYMGDMTLVSHTWTFNFKVT